MALVGKSQALLGSKYKTNCKISKKINKCKVNATKDLN